VLRKRLASPPPVRRSTSMPWEPDGSLVSRSDPVLSAPRTTRGDENAGPARPRPESLEEAGMAGTWVVVPAFNEARVIGHTVSDLRTCFPNVVVVDDGSTDATAEEALQAGAVVARHALNLGQGASLQTGIECALIRGARYVATFDADGQHHANDLVQMLAVLRERQLDIVLGSRFLGHTEGMSAGRHVALRAAVMLTNMTTGVRLTDAHNGLRVMTAETARRIEILQDQMAHASEVVAQIARLNLRFAEVPVTITYTKYSIDKGQRLTNSVRILSDLVIGWLLR
jgi:polyprenyl-phospho-N-acetylgalactosaminyl synthase